MRQVWAVALAAGLATAGLAAQDDALTARARAIHERVLTLDTHDDSSPATFTSGCNSTMDLGNQVNLPKMIKGVLDASFFVVYVARRIYASGRKVAFIGVENGYPIGEDLERQPAARAGRSPGGRAPAPLTAAGAEAGGWAVELVSGTLDAVWRRLEVTGLSETNLQSPTANLRRELATRVPRI